MANPNEDAIPLLSMHDYKENEGTPPAYDHSQAQQRARVSPSPQPQQVVTTPLRYPMAASQMANSNTLVVAQQPVSPPQVVVTQPSRKPTQSVLIFSLVLLTVCSLTCNFWSLFCLIPGVIFAVVGFNYTHSREPTKRQCGRGFNGVSLCLNVTTLVSVLVAIFCAILFVSVYFGIVNNRYSYHHYNYCQDTCTTECYPTPTYDYTTTDYYYDYKSHCTQVCSSCAY